MSAGYQVKEAATGPRLPPTHPWASQGEDSTPLSAFTQKDTVFITLAVLRGARHVQQDQAGIVGTSDNDFIELHSSVHAPHVGLIPADTAVNHRLPRAT